MFDIGFWELLTIGLLGLLILGPERLPGAIRAVQQSLHKMRAFGSRMEAEIKHELRVKELHENLKKIESTEDLDQLSPELKESLRQLEAAAASVRHPYAQKSAGSASGDQQGNRVEDKEGAEAQEGSRAADQTGPQADSSSSRQGESARPADQSPANQQRKPGTGEQHE